MSNLNSEYVEIKVEDGTTMLAWVSRPAVEKPRRGLLVFQEAFGVNHHIRDVTDRFAALGFHAIAPELFHRTTPSRWEGKYDDLASAMPYLQALTEKGLDADVSATYNWLRSNSSAGSNIACVGYCMGGRTSFIANSAVPLKAAISYYGGNIPPYLGRANKLSGPMLFFWGEEDHHIPPDQRNKVITAIREAKKEYTDIVFSNADHGFFCDERKTYEPNAARLSWDITRSFLDARMD